MQAVLQRQAGGVGVVQDAQDLPHGDGARARRREAAQAVVLRAGAVVHAQGLALFRLVARQVGQTELAGVGGVLLHLVHDGLGDLALVQGLAALGGDAAQHGGQFGVAQVGAHVVRVAVGLEEIGGGHRVFFQVGVALDQRVQARADLEAALGQLDGRLEQRGPGQLAVLAVRHLQHAHGAGHADRAATHHAVVEGQGLAAGVEEEFFVGSGRGRLAPVIGLYLAAAGVQQEGAAADAAGLRLDQRQHHLHRDGRVHRRAAGLEHLVARVGGQRVGGGHGELRGGPARLLGVARGGLGLAGRGVVERWCAGAASERGGQGQRTQAGGMQSVHGRLSQRMAAHGSPAAKVVLVSSKNALYRNKYGRSQL